jgi:hypothetical protein
MSAQAAPCTLCWGNIKIPSYIYNEPKKYDSTIAIICVPWAQIVILLPSTLYGHKQIFLRESQGYYIISKLQTRKRYKQTRCSHISCVSCRNFNLILLSVAKIFFALTLSLGNSEYWRNSKKAIGLAWFYIARHILLVHKKWSTKMYFIENS